MINLDSLKAVDTTAVTSTSTSLDVKISSMSGEIPGKFGSFRSVVINEKTYNVDAKRIKNTMLFTPNCDAVLTINQYNNATGELKTVISELSLKPKTGCGLFIMS